MKKSILLLLSIFLCISCKKNYDDIQTLRFSALYENTTTSINYDSIDYTAITYTDLSAPNDTQFVKMDIRKEYLSLRSGHTYVFTRFDMIGLSGNVMYYIPERTDNSGNLMPFLFLFRIPEDAGANLSLTVVRNNN